MAADWSPLADSDPVPGDPAALSELVRRLGGVADTIGAQLTRLRAIQAEEFWEGEAAAVFAEHQGKLPQRLDLLVQRYRTVSAALAAYFPELQRAQTMAVQARNQARQAEADIVAAERGIDAMEAFARGAQRAADTYNSANPGAPPRMPDPWTGPDHRAQLTGAQADMSAARTLLDQARDVRDRSASTAEGAVDAAVNDELENEGGLLGGLKEAWNDTTGWVYDNLPAISDVLGALTAVVGVAAFIFPVLAPVAFILGALTLALDTALAATGRGGWGDVAIGVIGMATFGIGRAFGQGGRAAATAARAAGAANRAQTTVTTATRLRGALATRNLTGMREIGRLSGRPIYGAALRSQRTAAYGRVIARGQAGLATANAELAATAGRVPTGLFPTRANWQRALSPSQFVSDLGRAGQALRQPGQLIQSTRNDLIGAARGDFGNYGRAPLIIGAPLRIRSFLELPEAVSKPFTDLSGASPARERASEVKPLPVAP